MGLFLHFLSLNYQVDVDSVTRTIIYLVNFIILLIIAYTIRMRINTTGLIEILTIQINHQVAVELFNSFL